MKLPGIVCGAVVGVVLATLTGQSVFAADAHNFQAGRIIDDAIFTNSNSMSVTDIQKFLESKVPNCDTYGAKTSELGGGTRAQWMASKGYYPPFRCTKDYVENPTTGANNYGTATNPSGGLSAAQLIYNYAKQFNINPQVLIVTLQKENGLITDEWPTRKQYTESMGFGCPDHVAPGAPACDPSYGSFSAQLYQAARHFRGFFDNSLPIVPYSTGQYNVMWSPTCTRTITPVYIQNRATAALYSYTPYQPNQAALNAGYGRAPNGDDYGCAAYGNRNFYLYFTDWFGSTFGAVNITKPLTITTDLTKGLYTGMTVKARFKVLNNTGQRQDIGKMLIAARDENGNNYDFGERNIVLNPYIGYDFEASRTFDHEGTYSFWITSYRDSVGWSDTYPDAINNYTRRLDNIFVQKIPTVNTAITKDVPELHVGQSTNVTFTVVNNSVRPVDLGLFGLALRDPNYRVADLPFDTVSNLAAGQSYVYNKQFTPQTTGTYNARISGTQDGGATWTETAFPAATSLSNNNQTSFTVKDNPSLTQGITIDTPNPRAGDKPSFSFKVKSFASSPVNTNKTACLIMRDQAWRNYDVGCMSAKQFTPGQELVFSGQSRPLPAGQYYAYFSMYDGYSWYDKQIFTPETGNEVKELRFTVKDNPTLTQGITLTQNSLHAGDQANFTFKLTNFATTAVSSGKTLCLIMRDQAWRNYDVGCLPVSTIDPGKDLVFQSQSRPLPAGQYYAFFSMYDGYSWYEKQSFAPETGAEQKELRFTVKDNPTLVQGITLGNQTLRAGDAATLSFKILNSSSLGVATNKSVCLIVRDSAWANYDAGCLAPSSVGSGAQLTYSGKTRTLHAGRYYVYFSSYDGHSWYDKQSFTKETGSEPTDLYFDVQDNPLLTQGITMNGAPPPGGTANFTFKLTNFATTAVSSGKTLCLIMRDQAWRNYDVGCLPASTIEPGKDLVFQAQSRPLPAGQYYAFFSMYDGHSWYEKQTFAKSAGSETTELRFTVQ